MKKTKWAIVIVLLILCLPFLLYGGIVVANNCIADSVEKDLRRMELPEGTELVESVSIAGKIQGNGNGMQYFGAILIRSDMSEEELQAFFGPAENGIFVSKQESSEIFPYVYYRFEDFDGGNLYTVSTWGDNGRGFWSSLLDLDLRGH